MFRCVHLQADSYEDTSPSTRKHHINPFPGKQRNNENRTRKPKENSGIIGYGIHGKSAVVNTAKVKTMIK